MKGVTLKRWDLRTTPGKSIGGKSLQRETTVGKKGQERKKKYDRPHEEEKRQRRMLCIPCLGGGSGWGGGSPISWQKVSSKRDRTFSGLARR